MVVQNWKTVLYIPTTSFFSVASLFVRETDEIQVWRLLALKGTNQEVEKNSYFYDEISVTHRKIQSIKIDYNFAKEHPLFKYSGFLDVMPILPETDYVLSELSIAVHRSRFNNTLPHQDEESPFVVLTFSSKLGTVIEDHKGSGSREFAEILDAHHKRYRCLNNLKHPHVVLYEPENYHSPPLCPECELPMTFENLCRDLKFKKSVLDLVGLIDAKQWHKSRGRKQMQYPLSTEVLRKVKYILDPRWAWRKRLLKMRTYRKTKQNVWIMQEADSK